MPLYPQKYDIYSCLLNRYIKYLNCFNYLSLVKANICDLRWKNRLYGLIAAFFSYLITINP